MKTAYLLGLFFTISLAAVATTQIVTFSGNVQVINNTNNPLPGVLPGQFFSGQFTYDIIPDQNPLSDVIGQYDQLSSISLTIRTSDTASLTLSLQDDVNILVKNGNTDSFAFNASGSGNDGYYFVNYDVLLEDNHGSVFSSDALPTNLSPAPFEKKEIYIYGNNSKYPGLSYKIRCDITAIESVSIPEPATLALLISGLAFLRKNK